MVSQTSLRLFAQPGPPGIHQPLPILETPDLGQAQSAEGRRDFYTASLLALFSAASVAASVNPVAANEVISVVDEDQDQSVELLKSSLKELSRSKESFLDALDPFELTENRTGELGSYQYQFQLVDADIKPRWKDGPALRFRSDFLETQVHNQQSLGEHWTESTQFGFRVRGEYEWGLKHEKPPTLDVQSSIRRAYSGPLNEDFNAHFSFGLHANYRLAGEEPGLSSAVSASQTIEGGSYQVFGKELSLHAEAAQSLSHHFETGETELEYRAMAGVRTQVGLEAVGLPGRFNLLLGPEIKGSTQGESFEPGFEIRARIDF